jgi:ribosomal protein S6--L-glutamate ligase
VPEILRLLREDGADVDTVYPDEEPTALGSLRVEHDLYVLKSGTETALSVAGALHAFGARILNPYPLAAICRDKLVTGTILDAVGVPVPETYALAAPVQLAPVLEQGPLVLKPARGSDGRGVRVLRSVAELLALRAAEDALLAQRYHEPDGPDKKIYCIGDEVFGIERTFPARTYEEKVGRSFVVDPELAELARRCGSALGLRLFGFDVVTSRGRHYVVDLSSFPGFKGVPDAAERLADYIYAVAAGDEPLIAISDPGPVVAQVR